MSRKGGKRTHWEPDVRKGMEIARKIKDIKEKLKKGADKRKINGFNPDDLRYKK